MPLRLVLVRHGLSTFNREHRIQGRDDLSSLAEEGVTQARLTGEALRDLEFAAVYSSPLSRARSTAELVLEARGSGEQVLLDDDLLEIDLAPWTGLLRDELRQKHPEAERRWREAPETLELDRPDGTTHRPLPDLMAQAERFIARLLTLHGNSLSQAPSAGSPQPQTVLVVAHNAILRCLLLTLLGLPASGFRRLRLDNASLSVLNLQRRQDGAMEVQIESLNSCSHLGSALPRRGSGPRLLLVRHGETDWNRQGRFQGQIDIPLNATGHGQAAAVRGFLAGVPLQRAYSSSMARPRQTAEAILGDHPGVPLVTTKGLVEIGHGLWEGRLESEIAQGWPQLLEDWKRTPQTVQMPEGETILQVRDRSLGAWRTIVRSLGAEETALVVAHDAVNKVILCDLLGLTAADIWSVKQGNGGVTVIDYPWGSERTAVVTSLNLTGHLGGGVLDRTAAGAL